MEAVTALDGVAGRVARGDALAAEDAQAILDTHDILEIGLLADGVRRRRHGVRTSFVRVLETHVEAPASHLPPGTAAGELRIVGAPGSVEAAVAAVRAVSSAAGDVPVTGFSLVDLAGLAGGSDALRALCARLREAGLRAVAEVPIDRLSDAQAAVGAARAGGLKVLRMTVHAMAAGERAALVERARALQSAVGGFHVFAPLPRTTSTSLPTTGYDDVKLVALARLLAGNIGSIQVDWALYGPKLAQVALTVGADDVDGVAAVDPGTLGTRRSPLEEILGNIRAAALEPVERDGVFRAVDRQSDHGR